jgi:hypothetical protein
LSLQWNRLSGLNDQSRFTGIAADLVNLAPRPPGGFE